MSKDDCGKIMAYHGRCFLYTFGGGVGFRFGFRFGLCCLGGGSFLRRGFGGGSLRVCLFGSTSCLGACRFCCFGSLLYVKSARRFTKVGRRQMYLGSRFLFLGGGGGRFGGGFLLS